jgi:hypothetical protein
MLLQPFLLMAWLAFLVTRPPLAPPAGGEAN